MYLCCRTFVCIHNIETQCFPTSDNKICRDTGYPRGSTFAMVLTFRILRNVIQAHNVLRTLKYVVDHIFIRPSERSIDICRQPPLQLCLAIGAHNNI